MNEKNSIKMTSRNITEVFVLMRNNAIQNRNMYDDRVGVTFRKFVYKTYGGKLFKLFDFHIIFLETRK